MPWFKGDDKFHAQVELAYISESAVCLFWCAVSWCSSAGTDGFVPEGQLQFLKGGRPEVAEELCRSYAGGQPWWLRVEGGYQIRTFLTFNPSKAQVQANREAEATRKAAWRAEKKASGKRPAGTKGGTGRVTDNGIDGTPDPVPDPSKKEDKPLSPASSVPASVPAGHWHTGRDDLAAKFARLLESPVLASKVSPYTGMADEAECAKLGARWQKLGGDDELLDGFQSDWCDYHSERRKAPYNTPHKALANWLTKREPDMLRLRRQRQIEAERASKNGRPGQNPFDAAEAAIRIAQEAEDVA